MPARDLPTPQDAATARRILLDGLARDSEISELVGELAPILVKAMEGEVAQPGVLGAADPVLAPPRRAADRADADQAVAVVRRRRTVMLGMPRSLEPGPLPGLPHRAGRDDQEQPA